MCMAIVRINKSISVPVSSVCKQARGCTTNAIGNAIGNPIDTDAIGYRVGYRGHIFCDWLSQNTSDCLSLGLSGLKSDRLSAELSGRY